jgi:hypothetical protein
MSALDSVMQWLMPTAQAASEPNYVQGQAQLRTPGHPTAFVLPADKYQSAVSAFGAGGEQGMTVSKPDVFSRLMSFANPTNRAIAAAGGAGPTVVLPEGASRPTIQHEATHALLKNGALPNAEAVDALIPTEGRASMARFYSPEQMAEEVPARAMTEPGSMQLDASGAGPRSGAAVRAQYLNMLQASDPVKAAGLRKLWAMQGAEAVQ